MEYVENEKGTEIINNANVELDIPYLSDWEATEENIFIEFKGDYNEARYDKILGLNEDNKLGVFIVKKNHYKERMTDICNVINYFETYFDENKELFHSTLSVKFIIDQRPNLSVKAFQRMIMTRVVTKSFVEKIKKMTDYLYTINIDTDSEGRYKNTPKITNAQAKLIVGISFAIRCILPLSIHYADTNNNFVNKKDYINCFDKIIMKIIKKFEKDDVNVFHDICKFVKYRVDRFWNQDIGICIKKKQLYGITRETYLEEVIHEVILVKSIHKLDYNRSVVSFIDGVIFSYHYNFKIENFKNKPIEIDAQESSDDDNERVTHAEAIDMSVYRIDESNSLINDVNIANVLKDIRKKFKSIPLTEEEFEFYYNNVRISSVTKLFLENFYSRFFHDPNAIINVNREVTIELLIYMKKFLRLRGLELISKLSTSKVNGKYKENTIKNSKFKEKKETSDIWNNVINEGFSYIAELNQKDNYIDKKMSSFINSSFELVEYDSDENGVIIEDINQDRLIYEFSLFLSIILIKN